MLSKGLHFLYVERAMYLLGYSRHRRLEGTLLQKQSSSFTIFSWVVRS